MLGDAAAEPAPVCTRGPTVAIVSRLGVAQTLAWASSFYLPAILGAAIARDLGVSLPTVYAVFSGALLLSGVVGPGAGRLIDRLGGRPLLMATNGLFAVGLVGLSLAQGLWGLIGAWAVLGLAMGSGLYEAAFASLVRLYGTNARGAITGVTLFAGFASTVGWPLSAWLETQVGWRGACLAWAGAHLVIGLPLNAWLPKARPWPLSSPAAVQAQRPLEAKAGDASPDRQRGLLPAAEATGTTAGPSDARDATDTQAAAVKAPAPARPGAASAAEQRRTMLALAWLFAATWFIATAVGTHLPALLQGFGLAAPAAVAVAALFGPAQVAGRLAEFGWLRRLHPLLSARGAACCHPLGALCLLAAGAAAAPVFAVLHGLGNGILTIAKGTLPLAYFGPAGYGERQGWLMLPARLGQAVAPFAVGLAIERWGTDVLWGSFCLGASGLLALAFLRVPPAPGAMPAASPERKA